MSNSVVHENLKGSIAKGQEGVFSWKYKRTEEGQDARQKKNFNGGFNWFSCPGMAKADDLDLSNFENWSYLFRIVRCSSGQQPGCVLGSFGPVHFSMCDSADSVVKRFKVRLVEQSHFPKILVNCRLCESKGGTGHDNVTVHHNDWMGLEGKKWKQLAKNWRWKGNCTFFLLWNETKKVKFLVSYQQSAYRGTR